MELRHLRYFVAVAEALNYRKAAQALRVAQPALSQQIKDLEEDIGARLLNRNTGGVTLTDAGVVLLEEARDILERVEMAAKAARDAESGLAGRLTVGSVGAISASFLPATLAAFRARFPRVEVNLHEAQTPDQIGALRAGVIQVGFSIEEEIAQQPGLSSTEVLVAPLSVAMGRGHRLAGNRTVSLADVADETFFCVSGSERNQVHRRLIEKIFAARHIRHRPIKRINGFESLVALVGGGHGLSLLLPFPPSVGKEELVFRPVRESGDDLLLRLLAIWRTDDRSQFVRNFIDVLRHHYATTRERSRPIKKAS